MPLTENKKWDHCIVVLGVRGVGKSTYALGEAVRLGRTPAYVLAHDPGYRLPERLPNGQRVVIHRHATIDAGTAALGAHPGGVHAFAVADGAEVLALGKTVSEASLQSNKGTHLVPAVVLLDEGVAVAEANPHRLGDQMRQDIALLRHANVALIITAQDPRYIHYSLPALSTEVVLFRLNDADAIKRVIRMGVPPALAAKAQHLGKYQFVKHKAF